MNVHLIRKILLVVAVSLLACPFAVAQENFQPGMVITRANDTLSGQIDYRNWRKNPARILFRSDATAAPVAYVPATISAFSVQEETYVSGVVEVEISPLEVGQLTNNPELSIVTDTAFLRTFFRGTKSLHLYRNKNGRENFYIGQGGDFELLAYKKYLRKQDGASKISEIRKYRNQLIRYLSDCPDLLPEIQGLDYDQRSLIRLFRQYYETCAPTEVVLAEEADRFRVDFGALVGISVTSLSFDSDNFAYLTEAGYSNSIDFAGGLFVDFVLPRNQGRWSIYNELLYTSYRVNGRYEEVMNAEAFTVTDTEFGYAYLKLNNLLRFRQPVGNLLLFLNAGVSNGFALNPTNFRRDEITFFSTERVTEGPAIEQARRYEQGFLLGAGLLVDKASLEFRFERGSGVARFEGVGSSTKKFLLLAGYRF